MKALIRGIAQRCRRAATMAAAVSLAMSSLHATAQQTRSPEQVEQLVNYAQCIRENGYPAFPDPGPDGGFKFLIERGSAADFQAAQQACKDKLPSGMMQDRQNLSPEQLETLVAFAGCVRDKGIANFPDPSPEGRFEARNLDLRTPQAQRAIEECREIHEVNGLMIRMGG